MRLISIGLGALNSTVGAVDSNTARAIELARAMSADGVTLGCMPEQTIGGYPAEDLVQWRQFLAAQRRALDRFASETEALDTVFVLGLAIPVGAQLFNCAAVVHRGRALAFVPKEKLPTYNVFYERRTFSRGGPGLSLESGGGVPLGDYIFSFDFGVLAVEVCEDAWSADGPMRRRCYSGAEVVVNISASPFRMGVQETRAEMLATRSADNQAVLVYANAVGGQDGLIFDGGGFVIQNGRTILAAPRFREGFASAVVDLDRTRRLRMENTTWRSDCEAFRREGLQVAAIRSEHPTRRDGRLEYPGRHDGDFLPPPSASPTSDRNSALDDLFEALALGVKDYFAKTGAFSRFGIAVSGGRDSALTLLVAWRAASLLRDVAPLDLGSAASELISAFHMPTRYSAADTRAAAEAVCRDLGLPLGIIPIDEAFSRELDAARTMLGGEEPTPIAHQNIQARLRAARMWNWANSARALFLQTGNMSEKAVGYTTIGGDLEGGLSVIANVPKTTVIALLERLEHRYRFAGIRAVLATTPGPELASQQSAESELMPFPVLDACLQLHAGERLGPREVAEVLPVLFPDVPADRLAEWAERFCRLFTASIYKWVQSPLALHVGSLDLDRERALQLPVVQRTEW
ncbi:MAG TPA: NAD(+) synthase [Vicinamibacterales bacterium]|nr:NAD(+) synthase [Vicinamibacterales bacterium]